MFDFNLVYEEYEKCKDLEEYNDEVNKINSIICSNYFDRTKAEHLIAELTTKYQIYLNAIARIFNNGMNVVPIVIQQKTDMQLCNDLIYIKENIPLIAICETGKSETLKKMLGLS